MAGIHDLHVDAKKYIGAVDILQQTPQIHVLLCADTLFLDGVYQALKEDPRYFSFTDNERPTLCFLPKRDTLVDGLTVAENIFMPQRHGLFLSGKKMEQACQTLFQEFGYYLNPSAQVSTLSTSQRHFVEFYRAYMQKPGVLLANEVTATLSYREIIYFDRIMQSLKEKGTSIFLLTTRCEDAMRLGDLFHIYVDGRERLLLTQQQVQKDPKRLFLTVMNVSVDEADGLGDERRWMETVSESMQVEDHFARIDVVLKAYCDRLQNLMDASFCRLYLYESNNRMLLLAGSSTVRSDFGTIKERELIMISEFRPLFVTNEQETGYGELFESAEYPLGTVCYHLKIDESRRLLLQLGLPEHCKEMTLKNIDMLRHVAVELLVFIENIRLHRQVATLQESNHRIKNNMQMILGYLTLQQRSLEQQMTQDGDRAYVRRAFHDLTGRIMAVYNVHSLISTRGNLPQDGDLAQLLQEIAHIYQDYLALDLHLKTAAMPQKYLLPLCIIFNELMNNTVKHNPDIGRILYVRITAREEDGRAELLYMDDGCGLGEKEPSTGSGIGVHLIETIVRNDLDGRVEILPAEGYCVKITFGIDGVETALKRAFL